MTLISYLEIQPTQKLKSFGSILSISISVI